MSLQMGKQTRSLQMGQGEGKGAWGGAWGGGGGGGGLPFLGGGAGGGGVPINSRAACRAAILPSRPKGRAAVHMPAS